jgi:hypothetical protein
MGPFEAHKLCSHQRFVGIEIVLILAQRHILNFLLLQEVVNASVKEEDFRVSLMSRRGLDL